MHHTTESNHSKPDTTIQPITESRTTLFFKTEGELEAFKTGLLYDRDWDVMTSGLIDGRYQAKLIFKAIEIENPTNQEKWHTDDGTNPHPVAALGSSI